jgi:hypothetical protein
VGEENLEEQTPPIGQESKTGFEELVLKINRSTNELIFTDPKTGKETKIKAQFVEEEKEAPFELKPPLTATEFQEVWNKLDKLGITWNTDIPPTPVFKPGCKRDTEFWAKFLEIQRQYPNFPNELSGAVLHALLHPTSDKPIDGKVQSIDTLLSQDYRAEFFFKYATKVSSFEEIDWEVVVKAYEKGTERMPKIAYALLSLVLRNPVNTTLSLEEAANEHLEPEFVTVAVNEKLVDKLISRLVDVKAALEKAQAATSSLPEYTIEKEGTSNGPSSS